MSPGFSPKRAWVPVEKLSLESRIYTRFEYRFAIQVVFQPIWSILGAFTTSSRPFQGPYLLYVTLERESKCSRLLGAHVGPVYEAHKVSGWW